MYAIIRAEPQKAQETISDDIFMAVLFGLLAVGALAVWAYSKRASRKNVFYKDRFEK